MSVSRDPSWVGDEDSGSEFSDESSKRKRESMDKDIFKRSKIIIRSPAKASNTSTSTSKDQQGGNMDEVKDMFEALMNEMKEIRKENLEFREEMREIKLENGRLISEVEKLKKKVEQLESIEQTVERIEKERIKNNIVITGLRLNEESNEQMKLHCTQFIRECLETEAEITTVQKINDVMLVVGLENFQTKMKIMKTKGKMEYLKQNKIYINSDLTKEERKIQRIIRERAKEEKEKGNTVTTGYQNIIVNGKKWKWNKQLKRLQEETRVTKN